MQRIRWGGGSRRTGAGAVDREVGNGWVVCLVHVTRTRRCDTRTRSTFFGSSESSVCQVFILKDTGSSPLRG